MDITPKSLEVTAEQHEATRLAIELQELVSSDADWCRRIATESVPLTDEPKIVETSHPGLFVAISREWIMVYRAFRRRHG